jgi:hypothetical protein
LCSFLTSFVSPPTAIFILRSYSFSCSFLLVSLWSATAVSHLVSSSPLCRFCRNGVGLVYNLQCVRSTVIEYEIL